MGWGTTFNPRIYLSKITVKSMRELDDLIEENCKYVADVRERLLMIAIATPKDIFLEDPLHEVRREVNEELELLEDSVRLLARLDMLKTYVEEFGFDGVVCG